MLARKKKRGEFPLVAVWLSGAVGGRSRLRLQAGKKGGRGLLGNDPPSLEAGELYNLTRLYCFLTNHNFWGPPVYLSRIVLACYQHPYIPLRDQ